MHLQHYSYLHKIIFSLSFFISYRSLSQCSPQVGAPPSAHHFSTGQDDGRGNDLIWKIAKDSINGIYNPATIMSPLPPVYYNGNVWISFSATGEHGGDKYFFYKTDFNLPCFDSCGKSYNDDNTFCLNLDLYADNSIYEIYVNGITQSGNLGNIIPLPNPFNPPGHTESEKTPVSLCKNWKAGTNSLIIQIASSATVAGMMAEPPLNPPPPPDSDTIPISICEGETYHFGNKNLTSSGYYFQSFTRPGGCDSNVVINLTVKQKSFTTISKTICSGQSYLGYINSGTYVNTFLAANGCDSVQTLQLIVKEKPKPDLGNRSAICVGDSLILFPGLFSSYLWQDGSTDDHYIVTKPGLYSVAVSNNCGTTINELLVSNGVCDVYFPNAFTPNNDGRNDFFKILTDLNLQYYHLSVYNRWGLKVFESTDPLNGWNGIFNKMEQPSGVYVWNCSFKSSNLTKNMKGTVALIR